jgi:hypothetical protein
VSRYDDAGPNRNIMERPDQQNHPITRSLAILLTALLESATASAHVRFNHDLIICERSRTIEVASNTIFRRTSRDKKYNQYEIIGSLDQRQYTWSLGCSRNRCKHLLRVENGSVREVYQGGSKNHLHSRSQFALLFTLAGCSAGFKHVNS